MRPNIICLGKRVRMKESSIKTKVSEAMSKHSPSSLTINKRFDTIVFEMFSVSFRVFKYFLLTLNFDVLSRKCFVSFRINELGNIVTVLDGDV